MAAPRKIFRIEEVATPPTARAGDGAQASLRHAELMRALGALRAAVPPLPASAANTSHAADAAQSPENLTRIVEELAAVIAGSAQATQKVLAAAEEIDQLANNLSAALKGRVEQEAAQDIRDQIIHIFEACNFQDLVGQRVNKVIALLDATRQHAAKPCAGGEAASPRSTHKQSDEPLHGPRLDSDSGHLTQREIDLLFGF